MNEEMIKRAEYFFKDKLLVHIKTKKGGFYNGIIKEMSADFFILNERLLGEMPIFFLEIERIEPYNNPTKKEGVDYS